VAFFLIILLSPWTMYSLILEVAIVLVFFNFGLKLQFFF